MAGNFSSTSGQRGNVLFGGSGSQRGGYRGRGISQTNRSQSESLSRSGSVSVGFGGRSGSTRSFGERSIPVCSNCGRKHTGECWGSSHLCVIIVINPGISSGIVLY
ncbi:UNVERIFIED_CONTAM: hypothetical protein Slati_2500600 [Sesamum latifolium]|uniref:Uncharacterized protein n=1 Tax=Sesamum latifolium TaxID=2727402 RepID=A0AAW2WHQ0_9LAMI